MRAVEKEEILGEGEEEAVITERVVVVKKHKLKRRQHRNQTQKVHY